MNLLEQISQPGVDVGKAAAGVVQKPVLIPDLLAALSAKQARTKFTSAKVLRAISQQAPAVLLPYWDNFIALLEHENNILRWEAIRIVARLAAVDPQNRFDAGFARFFAPISGPTMITAANTIAAGAELAVAKPALAEAVTREILKVQRARYQTDECRNVAIGHAIQALDHLAELVSDHTSIVRFVRKQLANSRSSTRKKAEAFLKRHEKSAVRRTKPRR